MPAILWQDYLYLNYEPSLIEQLQPFDQQKWLLASKSNGNLRTRFCMIRSLTERYKLIGMTKQDLIALLGNDYESTAVGRRREYLIYPIGTIHGYRKWLCFSLMDEQVSGFEIKQVNVFD
jgi:hypothetical protein